MALLLQILGVLFLLLIALIIAGILALRWKIRSFARQMSGMAEAASASQTPSRLHLDRVVAAGWSQEEEVKELLSGLSALGFEPVGSYHTREVGGLIIDAWLNPEARAWGIVYEHPRAGVWLDLVSVYEDGSRVTFANTSQGTGVDHAPGHTVERFPGLDAQRLFDRFLKERPVGPLVDLRPQEFPERFERAYADEMDWRNSRGGVTPEEIRRIAALSGETYDDATLRELEAQTRENARLELDRAIIERFLETSNMPARAWEEVRDRLVIVHDGLLRDEVRDRIEDHLEEGTEGFDDEDEDDRTSRAAFADFNESLPRERKFRKIGSVTRPVAADLYAAPE